MGKIFKNFLPHIWTVLLIIALLVIQANCDLALPEYTSKIIDTGIQNKGVEHILPEKITVGDYNRALLFMNDDEKAVFSSAYKKDGKILNRSINDEKSLKKLDQKLIIPIASDYEMTKRSAGKVDENALAYSRKSLEKKLKAC